MTLCDICKRNFLDRDLYGNLLARRICDFCGNRCCQSCFSPRFTGYILCLNCSSIVTWQKFLKKRIHATERGRIQELIQVEQDFEPNDSERSSGTEEGHSNSAQREEGDQSSSQNEWSSGPSDSEKDATGLSTSSYPEEEILQAAKTLSGISNSQKIQPSSTSFGRGILWRE